MFDEIEVALAPIYMHLATFFASFIAGVVLHFQPIRYISRAAVLLRYGLHGLPWREQ